MFKPYTTFQIPRVLIVALSGVLILSVSSGGQQGTDTKNPSQANAPARQGSAETVFKTNSRLVTLDVIAKDKHGQIVTDLKPEELHVFEQVVPTKTQHEQKITDFNFVSRASIAAASKQGGFKVPAGVYTNLVNTKLTVPPTILLVDGLNTDVDAGMQARRQMVKMLASIPTDTPVAVFLLGRQLILLQSFTKDPNLLREAAKRALAMDNQGLGTVDPRDDPGSLSNQVQEMFGGDDEAPPSTVSSGPGAAPSGATGPPGGEAQMAEIRRFEKETFSADIDVRVRTTLDALRTIARHVSGYPGRKNLLWISSSFPISIGPDALASHSLAFEGNRNYQSMIETVTNALADAKVAVYPVNPAGVETQGMFDAAHRPARPDYGARQYEDGRTLNRENETRFSSQESMTEVADATGGKICINNNDLTDCVKSAVDEGSSYYEVAYYPSTGDWHGEFHHVIVKTSRPGLQLSFREGYFAGKSGNNAAQKDKAGNDVQLQQAACEDFLTSTSVLVVARALPPDKPDQAKYFLAIDSKMLTFAELADGNRELHFDVAICSYDQTGKPLQYLQDSSDKKISDKDYQAMNQHAIPHVIQFTPNPAAKRVRLVVRDDATGELGSLDVPYPPGAPVSSPAAKNNILPATPQPNQAPNQAPN